MDESPTKHDLTGVDTFYFLSQFNSGSIILSSDLWKTESILLDYFNLNFGISSNASFSDHEITKSFRQITINEDKTGNLNEIIHLQKPINKANLSKRNLNTQILRSFDNASYREFEIVIAKDKSTTDDLFYFWNRILFEVDKVIYLTQEELNLLVEDKFFGHVIHDMSTSSNISVTSLTLSSDEIEDLIVAKLNPTSHNRTFKSKNINNFPFPISDLQGFHQSQKTETVLIQNIFSENGLFNLPKLSFTNKIGFYPQQWALDIEINDDINNGNNGVMFPFSTQTRYIIKNAIGRVNRTRNITIFNIEPNIGADTLEIHIPSFNELIRQLIISPVIDSISYDSRYVDIGLHDSSNKLSAFVRSFHNDFQQIDDFFTDKFWVGIFEELITNKKASGDSITFEELKLKCINTLVEHDIVLGLKEATNQNDENLGACRTHDF
ncbi:hypothetical protein [Dyadobacter sp. 3J3]|uniref:hypothetical protein n=1 Tax=Dyadobacter sp. 3J3 TaxID=2606600 RepID=UPI00135AE77B|nr:hypothetical protein [Dyadobacter sp. 3J3]